MQSHEVDDPGQEAADAGVHLFENQLPQYGEKIADSMNEYLIAGAQEAAAKARLSNAVADEIMALEPRGAEGPEDAQEAAGLDGAILGTPPPKKDEGVLCEYSGHMVGC